jgi:hypothetical protein
VEPEDDLRETRLAEKYVGRRYREGEPEYNCASLRAVFNRLAVLEKQAPKPTSAKKSAKLQKPASAKKSTLMKRRTAHSPTKRR